MMLYVFKVPDNNRGQQHAQHVLVLATTRCVHVRSTVKGSLKVNTAHVTFN